NRYEQIQSSLVDLTYATSEQLRVINNLGGDRNARRILLDMERMGYIKSIRHDRKIYYVNTRLRKKEIQHILMRNELYVKYGLPKDWKKEVPIRKNEEILVIPDAMFSIGGNYYFVEVDHMQQMKINYEKIEKYKEVGRMIFNKFKHHPTLVWYTISDNRKRKLEEKCREFGVKYVIY